jgi:hypothetical protein
VIELTCWGCGWDGWVAEQHAGLRVRCKRCEAVNVVPDPVTREVYAADWRAAIDEATETGTVEVDTRRWPVSKL